MLTAAEVDLIARDPELPGLARVLDGPTFVKAVQPYFTSTEILGSQSSYVRYKPGMNCLVAHQLQTSEGVLEVYAKAHRAAAIPKLEKAQEENESDPYSRELLVLSDDSIIVRGFPSDAKLRSLRALSNPERWGRMLSGILGRSRADTEVVLPQRLSYKPERRFVAQLMLEDRGRCVVRFYTEGAMERSWRILKYLSSREKLVLAPAVGRSLRHSLLVTEWLEGSNLRVLIRNSEWKPDQLELVGGALAELHRQGLKRAQRRSRKAESQNLRNLAEHISFLSPAESSRSVRLVNLLSDWLGKRSGPKVTLHGDFYDNQVIIGSRGAGLVDLDDSVRGDARLDLGNFIAHLELDVMFGLARAEVVEPITESLLKGYAAVDSTPVRKELGTYVAFCLFGLAHEPFRRVKPGWPRLISEILRRIEELATAGSAEYKYSLIDSVQDIRPESTGGG